MKLSSSTKVMRTILLMLLAASFTFVVTFLYAKDTFNDQLMQVQQQGDEFTKFSEIRDLITKNFVGEYDRDMLLDFAMKGYVDGLGDKWSHYLTKEEYADFVQKQTGTFGGIGIAQQYDDVRKGISILEVYKDSAAEKAGLLPLDLITQVNGETVADTGYNNAMSKIQGNVGEPVKLTITRDKDGKTEVKEISVIRELRRTQTVFPKMLSGKIGYIHLSEFTEDTHLTFKVEMDKLISSGAAKLILDLRNNPGGTEKSMIAILNLLMDKKQVIFVTKDKNDKEHQELSDGTGNPIPLLVIVNEHTYSAAEYFAAVMQEYGRAKIVGEPTTGKSYAQVPVPLKDGSGVIISTLEYFTPKHVSLAGTGITPDVVIGAATTMNAAIDFTNNVEGDKYVSRAMTILNPPAPPVQEAPSVDTPPETPPAE